MASSTLTCLFILFVALVICAVLFLWSWLSRQRVSPQLILYIMLLLPQAVILMQGTRLKLLTLTSGTIIGTQFNICLLGIGLLIASGATLPTRKERVFLATSWLGALLILWIAGLLHNLWVTLIGIMLLFCLVATNGYRHSLSIAKQSDSRESIRTRIKLVCYIALLFCALLTVMLVSTRALLIGFTDLASLLGISGIALGQLGLAVIAILPGLIALVWQWQHNRISAPEIFFILIQSAILMLTMMMLALLSDPHLASSRVLWMRDVPLLIMTIVLLLAILSQTNTSAKHGTPILLLGWIAYMAYHGIRAWDTSGAWQIQSGKNFLLILFVLLFTGFILLWVQRRTQISKS